MKINVASSTEEQTHRRTDGRTDRQTDRVHLNFDFTLLLYFIVIHTDVHHQYTILGMRSHVCIYAFMHACMHAAG